jgi:hypothetical protein
VMEAIRWKGTGSDSMRAHSYLRVKTHWKEYAISRV